MNYTIAKARDDDLKYVKDKLEETVNFLMAEGYKPQGSVSIATEMHGYKAWYIAFQAMIKE